MSKDDIEVNTQINNNIIINKPEERIALKMK